MATVRIRKKIKLASVFILVVSLISLVVSASSPPSLPTLIYGKVGYSSGEGMPGARVTAEWGGKSASTTTLTLEEAIALGNYALVGSYKFEGNIDAGAGTIIKIKSMGKEVSVKASLGILTKAPEIILDGEADNGFVEKITNYLSSLLGLKKKV